MHGIFMRLLAKDMFEPDKASASVDKVFHTFF
jgi:hypothetical protein